MRSFGAVIALMLLGLYVYLVGAGLVIVYCVAEGSGCTSPKVADYTSDMASALSVVSGLVSALVISELSITKPGQVPLVERTVPGGSSSAKRVVGSLVISYLLVWVVAGAWTFFITLRYAHVLPVLTDLGRAWFGLAIASSYAYFGLKAE